MIVFGLLGCIHNHVTHQCLWKYYLCLEKRSQYSKQFVPKITKMHVNVLNTVASYFPDIDKRLRNADGQHICMTTVDKSDTSFRQLWRRKLCYTYLQYHTFFLSMTCYGK